MRNPFPAVQALHNAGKLAVPAIADVLARESTSVVARKKGIYVLRTIFGKDISELVRVLKRASINSTDPGSARLLMELAQETALCRGPAEIACKQALQDELQQDAPC